MQNESGLFKVQIISETQNLSNYITTNSVEAALLTPSNFITNLYTGSEGYIVLKGHTNPTVASADYQTLNGILTQINFRASNATQKLILSSEVAIGNTGKTIDYCVPGLIGFTVLSTMFNMIYTVPNYRRERLFRQFAFSGLTKSEWITANMMFSFLMLILSDVILVAIGIYVFGASLQLNAATILTSALIVFGGLFFFTSVGILAGLVRKTKRLSLWSETWSCSR